MTCLDTRHCCLVIRQKSHQKGCDATSSPSYTHGIIIVFLLQKTEKQRNSKIYHIFMRDFLLFLSSNQDYNQTFSSFAVSFCISIGSISN